MSQFTLKLSPKVTYLKLISLRPSVLGQNFKDLVPKITYLNKDLGSLKPSKVCKQVQYQHSMVLRIFKITPNCPKNLCQVNYLRLIVLRLRVLGQYFKDLTPKITYLNKDFGSLKLCKVWTQFLYQILMVLRIFKIGPNCKKIWS